MNNFLQSLLILFIFSPRNPPPPGQAELLLSRETSHSQLVLSESYKCNKRQLLEVINEVVAGACPEG